jgi:hypothetical protein
LAALGAQPGSNNIIIKSKVGMRALFFIYQFFLAAFNLAWGLARPKIVKAATVFIATG